MTSIRAAWIYLSAGWLYGLPLGIPISPYDVDRSWQAALSWAAERQMTHGQDILFTYGPLGFLLNPVLGANGFLVATCLVRLLVRSGIAFYCARETTSAFRGGQSSMIPVFGFALALGLSTTNDLIVVFLVLVLAKATARGAWLPCALAGLAGGALLLSKFNNGIQCVLTLIVLMILVALQQERTRGMLRALGAAVASLILVLLAFWAAGWVALGPFFVDSWHLASAYSQLSIYRPAEELTAFATLVFLGALFLQAVHPTHKPDRWTILACLPAAFLFFKSAFVRAEELHVVWGTAAFIGLWAGASLRLRSPTLTGQLQVVILVGAVLSLLSAAKATLLSPSVWQQKALDVSRGLLPGMEPLSPALFQAPPSVWEVAAGQTVDVYPHDVGLLAPVHERWHPRYVIQAYATLHPALDRKTARRLETGQGADWILFKLESLDMSHLALTDVAGWNALSRHYQAGPDPTDLPDSIWLKRRDEQPAREVTTREGTLPNQQWVKLPETDGVVRLSLQIRRTLPGKLFDMLFKVYPPVMDVEFTDGQLRSYRFNWRNAANGMIVSHVPRTRTESKAWFSGTLPQNVRRVRVVRFSRAFAPEVPLQWTIERSISPEDRSDR